MAYEPLHHKYRPQTFADLVGQEAIATTLTNAILQSRIAPAYLFSGPRGTGKTSSARILAKSLNCQAGEDPTPTPCGVCEACRSIVAGSALDVIEIDAASNTGVDNIRELIEKAQFAPVQCRFKVYVIDECLTGDTLVQTEAGPMRIDDPSIQGQRVLSYNETSEEWEYKPVVRWLDQGDRQTYIIKTNHRRIQCTGNHLIRTEQGWVAAKDVREKTKILSPVNVCVGSLSTNTEQMGECAGSSEVTNSEGISTVRELTASKQSCEKLMLSARSVPVAAVRSWRSPHFSKPRVEGCEVSSPTGNDIPTKRAMDSGKSGPKTSLPSQVNCLQNSRASSTVPCWEMDRLPIPMPIAVSLDWLGPMVKSSGHGWSTKLQDWPFSGQKFGLATIRAMAIAPPVVTAPAIPNSVTSIPQSKPTGKSKSQRLGSATFPLRVEHGGIWMTAPSPSTQLEHHPFSFIRKDFQNSKTNSLPNGCANWGTWQRLNSINEPTELPVSSTSSLVQKLLVSGSQSTESMHVPLWHTSFETVESIECSTVEAVYDIEVEDNHNFVANGLLVHNCHMLSTAAFNALLKTLEEPPDRVVFVLATTDPQRVLPTIISRCQRFDYRRIPLESMVSHLQLIADREQISIEAEALTLVAQLAQGGLRDAESLLDQLSLLPPPIEVEAVWDLVGAVPERELLSLVEAIASNNPEFVIDRARNLMNRGREPLIVLQNLASFYRDLLIAKTAPQRNDLVAITASTWEQLTTFVQKLEVSTLLQGQQHLRSSEVQLKNTTQPRLWLEVTLMGLLPGAIAASGAPVSGTAPTPLAVILPSPPVSPPASSTRPSPPQTVSPPPSPPAAVQASASASPPAGPTPSSSTPTVSGSGQSAVPNAQDPSPVMQEPAAPASQVDLKDLWKRAIAGIEFFSTQALLRQQGRLQSYTGTVAKIGIPTQWMSNLQGKLPAIEAAFSRAAGGPIKVQFEAIAQAPLASMTPPSAPSPPIPPPPAHSSPTHSSPAPPSSPAVPTPPAQDSSPAPSSFPSAGPPSVTPSPLPASPDSVQRTESSAQPPEQQTREPASSSAVSPAPLPSATSPSIERPTPSSLESSAAAQLAPLPTQSASVAPQLDRTWDEDELLRAAKSLAQFFNGEVVQDQEVLPEGIPTSPTPETLVPAHSIPVQSSVTAEDWEDDDDVPF